MNIHKNNTVVILSGTSRYDRSLDCKDLEQVELNIKKLFSLLSDPFLCGIDLDNIHVLLNYNSVYFLESVERILKENRAKSRLLFYYCGHGKPGNEIDDLIFPMENSRKTNLNYTGMQFKVLGSLINKSLIKSKVVIIDTCYSGRAADSLDLDIEEEELPEIDIEKISKVAAMTASQRTLKAKNTHPILEKYTLLTGEIIRVVYSGISGEAEQLDVQTLFGRVRDNIIRYSDCPEPKIVTSIDPIPFFYNARRGSDSKIGLVGIYDGDTDGDFDSALKKAIKNSQEQIVFIGWGLAFLSAQNRPLTNLLKSKFKSSLHLKVNIFMVSPEHPGLRKRIDEEKQAQQKTGILGEWPISFYEFLEREFFDELNNQPSRFSLARINYMPSSTIVKLDNRYFYRPYGPPNRGGHASPWIEFDSFRCSPAWLSHFSNEVQFAIENHDVHGYTGSDEE